MTPRKEEVPREKPWLWRRTAMISSSRLILSMHSVRSAYLHGGDRQSETIQGPKRDQLFQGDAVYALRQVRVPARGNTSGLAMYVLQLRSMLRLQLDSTSTASASSGLKLAESARSGRKLVASRAVIRLGGAFLLERVFVAFSKTGRTGRW